MPCKDDRVSIARQNLFNLFVKGSIRNGHSLTREFIHTLFADVGARDSPAARHVEREIVRAGLQISIDITSTECRVGFSNRCLKWMRHAPEFIKKWALRTV
jgi:hypothetical protein